jgi:uncharacterized protein (DUF433 family)
MQWQERIVADPSILVGKPVIKGTRLSVEFIIDLLAAGWRQEQILANYPNLTPEDIRACLAYASELLHDEKVFPLKPA